MINHFIITGFQNILWYKLLVRYYKNNKKCIQKMNNKSKNQNKNKTFKIKHNIQTIHYK